MLVHKAAGRHDGFRSFCPGDQGSVLFVVLRARLSSQFHLTSPIDKSQQHRNNNFLEMLRIKLGTAGLEARMVPLCYAAPSSRLINGFEKLNKKPGLAITKR